MADAGKKGMETEKVKAIAARLDASARGINAAIVKAEGASKALKGRWQGTDAETFFAGWPANRAALEEVAQAVEEMRKTLRQQIQDQKVTSEANIGAGSGGPSSPSRTGDGDSDGDGTPDSRDPDDDGDGSPDSRDPDDDRDGTPDEDDDAPESPRAPDGIDDADHDSRGDNVDPDDDNDGIPDVDDDDGDGDNIPDDVDPDDDNNETPDVDEPQKDGIWEKPGFDEVDTKVTYTTLAEGEVSLWDESLGVASIGDPDGNHASIAAVATEAKGEGKVALTNEGLVAAGSVGVGAYAFKGEASYQNKHGTSASAEGYLIGAEAKAEGTMSFGADGVKANVGGEVFYGGKAEAHISQDLGPVDVGVGGEISYGIGAHADVDAEFSSDHIGVDFDIGATLGIGGGIKIDIGFDPPW